MKVKKVILYCSLIFLSFVVFTCYAYGADVSDLKFQTVGENCVLISCETDASGTVVVPEKIEGKKVVSIAKRAFYNCNKLKNIQLPDTVTQIDEEAFFGCSSISSFNMPDSVNKLGKSVFSNCYGLKQVKLSAGISILPQKTFYLCESLTDVIFGSKIISFGASAFYGCKAVRYIVSPEKLSTVSSKCFSNCTSLRKIYIPKGLETIEGDAFEKCSDISVYYEGSKKSFENLDVASGNSAFINADVYFNHIHKNESKVIKTEATCVDNGYSTYFCSCSKEFVDDFVSAKGHNLSVFNTIAEPTCKKAGYAHLECERCNYYEKVSLPMKSHRVVTDKAISADCYSSGKTKGSHCGDCGTVIVKQKNVPALGHNFTKKIKDKAHLASKATYTKPSEYYYSCSRCVAISTNKTFSGEKLVLGATSKIITSSEEKSITLLWNKVKNATGYYVYLKNSKGKYELKSTVKSNKAVISGLTAGKVYSLRVKAYVTENKTTVKSPSYTQVNISTAPQSPSKLAATQNEKSIKLTWSASKGATGYRIYSYNAKTKKWTVINSGTKKCSCTVKNLKSGTVYRYCVKPYITVGKNTVWSKSAKGITTCTRPESPVLKATSLKGAVRLSWNKVNGADGYIIYGSSKPDSGYKKIAVTTANTFTKKNLLSGRTYYFKAYSCKKLSKNYVYSYAGEIKTVKTK